MTPASASVLWEPTLWQAIAAVAAMLAIFTAVLLWAVSAIVRGAMSGLRIYTQQVMGRLEEDLKAQAGHLDVLEQQMRTLELELPHQYLRRDDWIRFGAVIDGKLDAVHRRLDRFIGAANDPQGGG